MKSVVRDLIGRNEVTVETVSVNEEEMEELVKCLRNLPIDINVNWACLSDNSTKLFIVLRLKENKSKDESVVKAIVTLFENTTLNFNC